MFYEESADGLLLPTRGMVTVDLVDERGKVLQREESENFLSVQSINVAKWWQRLMWGAYNPIETNDAVGNKPSEMPWFPAQHLAYWADSAAESAGTEDLIKGDLIGWASRHPVGSPSGKRGVVNITESEFTDAHAKWVFDWTTSQGNGTFQSVGWTRVDELSGFPVPRFPEDDGVSITTAGAAMVTALGTAAAAFDGTNWFVLEVANISGNGTIRVSTAASAGGSTTPLFTFPSGDWTYAGDPRPAGLCLLGTAVITCGASGANAPRLTRHTNAGAQTWLRDETSLTGVSYIDVTVDGSGNIWTVATDGKMRRHDPSNGTVTATVTPALAPSSIVGIAYDSGDSNFWLQGTVGGRAGQVWKVDNSGNTVSSSPFFSVNSAAETVTSSAPFVGTYNVPGPASREPFALREYRGDFGGTTTGDVLQRSSQRTAAFLGQYQTALVMKGGEVWLAMATNAVGAGGVRLSALRGGTLGTRSKLSSAITKTNTQALKITYQFNFS